jgi:phosphatidate cytidylyltransferase
VKFQREVTAGVLIPAVLLILVKGEPWMFSLLVAAATSLALWEFFGLVTAAGWAAPRIAGLVLLWGILAAAHVESWRLLAICAGAALFGIPTLVLFASPPAPILFPSSAASVFATLYVAAGGASIIGLRAFSWKAVCLLLAVVWIGDSAAYYAGRRWGQKRLAPVVSPKKTWAGLVGQLVGGAVLAAVAIAWTAERPSPLTILLAAAFGAGLSLVAAVGDLVESTFKRSTSVKDSGGLLPGHGGLLDRLDSLLYASPVMLLSVSLFPQGLPR